MALTWVTLLVLAVLGIGLLLGAAIFTVALIHAKSK